MGGGGGDAGFFSSTIPAPAPKVSRKGLYVLTSTPSASGRLHCLGFRVVQGFGALGLRGPGITLPIFEGLIYGNHKKEPGPEITYRFFRDLHKEIIIRNPKEVGSLGSR